MNKLFGWLIVIVSTAYLLLYSFWLFDFFILSDTLMPSLLSNDFIVFCSIIAVAEIAALIYGSRILIKKTLPAFALDRPFSIYLKGKTNINEYGNATIELTFKGAFYKRIILFAAAILAFYAFLAENVDSLSDFISDTLIVYIMIVFMLAMPFLNYLRIIYTQKSAKLFTETMEYHISNDHIHIKTESAEGNLKWTHFIKARETKQFFFLYPNKITANSIDKKQLNEEQLSTLTAFIRSLPIFTT